MLAALQKELYQKIGFAGFVRRCTEDHALFISDAPRRLSAEEQREITALLLSSGFQCTLTQENLWNITLTQPRLFTFLQAYLPAVSCHLPEKDALHSLYALSRLLHAHPALPQEQPTDLLYALMKRMDRPQELLCYAPIALKACAKRLRCKQPLPSMAEGILSVALQKIERGESF